MPTFAESWDYQNLLSISKSHLDALDRSRIIGDKIIGQDNVNNLCVSTVFAAIAVETALNDYLTIHYLFLDVPYLQAFFAETKDRLLRSDVHTKIRIVTRFWPDKFPDQLLVDVREVFRIRNRIVHQTPELEIAKDNDEGKASVTNSRLTEQDMTHMLRHYDIASSFLALFWLPGTRELQQWSGNPNTEPQTESN